MGRGKTVLGGFNYLKMPMERACEVAIFLTVRKDLQSPFAHQPLNQALDSALHSALGSGKVRLTQVPLPNELVTCT